MMNDNVAIARAAYDAYISKDRGALEALCADDFHFTSPLDNRLDRTTYFSRCWLNSKTIDGFEVIYLVSAGERVLVTYEGRATGGHWFRPARSTAARPGRRWSERIPVTTDAIEL